jgi:hypothetical protein
MTCHPPDHLRPDQIRREGQGTRPTLPPPPAPAADLLFRQAGIDLDEGGSIGGP